MRIRFDKVDAFIRVYDGTRYSVLFGIEKFNCMYNKIRYIVNLKSGITFIISHNYSRDKVHSYRSLSLEKSLAFHHFVILIKSVFHKDQNQIEIW